MMVVAVITPHKGRSQIDTWNRPELARHLTQRQDIATGSFGTLVNLIGASFGETF